MSRPWASNTLTNRFETGAIKGLVACLCSSNVDITLGLRFKFSLKFHWSSWMEEAQRLSVRE
jgi:hypothetical protein